MVHTFTENNILFVPLSGKTCRRLCRVMRVVCRVCVRLPVVVFAEAFLCTCRVCSWKNDDCSAAYFIAFQCVLTQDLSLVDPSIRRTDVFLDGTCFVCCFGKCKHLSMRLHVKHLSGAYRRSWGRSYASLCAVTSRRLLSRFNGFVQCSLQTPLWMSVSLT